MAHRITRREQASIRRCRFLLQGLLAITLGISQTAAATILIDDFNDGVPNGWSVIDPTPGTLWGPGNFYVNGKGEYRLASSGPVPVWGGPVDFLASAWEASSDPLFSEGWLQARVRVGEHFNNPSLSMRSSGSLQTGFSSYLFRLNPDLGPSDPAIPKGTICILRIGGPEGRDECVLYPHRVDEDLWVKSGTVGDEITMKVWRPGEVEPDEPQITMIDSHYSQGQFGVISQRHTSGGGWTFIGHMSSTFDDITFTPADAAQASANSTIGVPEPSGLMGMIAGSLMLGLLRRRRPRAQPHCMPSYRSARIGSFVTLLLAIGGIVSTTAQAQQVEIVLGTMRPDADPLEVPISIPEGTYNSILLMTDWSTPSGAWSREAIWTLTDGELAEPGTRYYANLSSAPNSAADSEPVTLVWDSFLDLPLHGPADLTLLAVHTFDGETPRWDNTFVEFSFKEPPQHPPLTAHLGTVAAEFDPLRLVTDGDFDTELGIYPEMTGNLIDSNDDSLSEDLRNTTHSEINFESGLPHGDYIAAVGSFNTSFDDEYEIIAGATGGNFSLSAGGVSVAGNLASDQVAYIGFTVGTIGAECDFNLDASCDIHDLNALLLEGPIALGVAVVPGENDEFDLIVDGVIDNSDVSQWLADSASTNGFAEPYLKGDTNLDGAVSAIDLNNLALNWGAEVLLWSGGDFNGDGRVNAIDLNDLALNWGQSIPTASALNAAVPEPSAWVLTIVGLALIVGRRSRG